MTSAATPPTARSTAPDAVDIAIVRELQADGRLPNAQLAERVGLSASACHARVRALVDRGVIRGFTAIVDPVAFGGALQALVSVRIRPGARHRMSEFAERLRERPEVAQLFFLGGAEDFLLHLWARDSEHVRAFVLDQLSADPVVAHTDTKLVFEHHAAAAPTALQE